MTGIVLIRHPEVAEAYRGICYGRLDVPLSERGDAQIADIVASLDSVTAVVHSGLGRARLLAEAIAQRFGVAPSVDARLAERGFGVWEGRSWDDIYAETGDAMIGMVSDPATWHPPGGETTFQLRDRVLAWYREQTSPVVVVTHGGPIAALLGTLGGHPVEAWPGFVPPCGASRWCHCRPAANLVSAQAR